MLFQLKPGTPISAIFTALNQEFIQFLEKSVTAKQFTQRLFSEDYGSAIWGNSETKKKFRQLWDKLKVLNENDRQTIALAIKNHQDLSTFFENLNTSPPTIGAVVEGSMEVVTRHLFTRTSHLVGIEGLCTETLITHFNAFKGVNGNVCCACGIQPLAEYRANVDDSSQWRSAFDHVLAITRYPFYGTHEKNLIPCCDHCNSKAKGSKNVLCNDDDSRRHAFYPHSQYCSEDVALELEFGLISPTPKLKLEARDPLVQEKINTWNSVYVISV